MKRVLVLEDNFIIAMEAEDILKSLGIEHVEIATNSAEASALIEAQSFDFALLDVNLGAETSFDFAGILVARGVAFGFVSGYGEDTIFPAPLRDIPRISKPFNEVSVGSLLGLAIPGQS
ncbi:response regulator [Pararhizobium sp. A13]|uniref:response regulator n=1 Tax=Pararhizobium sp. A13 TaxID=3133975 RepID=UPI003243390A